MDRRLALAMAGPRMPVREGIAELPNKNGQEMLSLTSFTWARLSLSRKREGGLSFLSGSQKDNADTQNTIGLNFEF
jgi:hypothetical protein